MFAAFDKCTKLIVCSHSKKVLNREGRAICRIVHAHGWSLADIGRVFGVSETSVSRAVDNVRQGRHLPRDRISEDYMRVKDPELFKKHFPPISGPTDVPEVLATATIVSYASANTSKGPSPCEGHLLVRGAE